MLTNAVNRSIARKFTLAMLATTCVAMLVASIAMLVLNVRTYQSAWANDLQSQADILGQANLPALEFGDARAAEESLAQLQVRERLVGAAILKPDRTIFVSYTRKGIDATLPKSAQQMVTSITFGKVSVIRPILRSPPATATRPRRSPPRCGARPRRARWPTRPR